MVNDIAVQDFVNAIKEEPQDTNKTYNATVSHIDNEGVVWVYLQGSSKETPTASTSTEVKKGDSVTVQWRNNKLYIGGNYSNPSVGFTTVMPSVDFVAELADKDVTVNSITATTGYIKDLTSENITTENIVASTGYIKDLTADHVTTGDIKAATGYIGDLTAGNVTAQNVIADHATVGSLDANYAHITNGVIDNAKIGYADVNDLDANFAHISNGVIDNAQIGYADVKDLNAHYANINLANVNNAWIENGVIKNGAIADAQIIGVSANKLTAGTIDASNITVTNLNASNITTGSITVDGITIDVENNEASIDGGYIEDGTVTLSGLAQDVTDKIDGAIETFTGAVVPTLNNYPASSWTATKVKDSHIGDVYYVLNADNTSDGYCYRFAKDGNTYKWVLIKDSDVTAALSRLTTAEGKISGLESFESTTSSWITNTDEELSSIKTNHTTLVGVVDKTLVETVQLWFTKANTTAPNKPTARVTTNDASKPNMWNIAVPTYNSSYPNYYYCYQWKYADGTYGWSSVTRDIAMGESQSTARTAASDASNAVSTANTASTNASNAVSTANTASTNASNAVSTANSAASTASAAQTTANSAASDASAAVSTANTASTNASNAVSTANTAKATADKNVKKAVQLWYTKANTTAPGKPTAHVTSTSTGGNAWRTVVPTYNASYPYYYYCYEYEAADGTYTWSDVVYDRATSEAEERARTAVTNAATAQTAAETADGKAVAAHTAATTADGKAVAAQNTANANIKSSVQLWFTKANTTAPSKPTAHVTTNDASKANMWNIAVPTYNASYPHYYYCYEYQKGSGEYTWSNVVYDRATTENQSNARSALSQVATKVETSTFNTLSQTVDSNTANITSLTTITENNGLTASTNITNTVNTVNQTATGNSSKISQLTTTLGTNADGTTKTGDIVHRTSAVEQDLSGFKTTVSETYQTKDDMSGYSTTQQMNSAINQKANEITQTVSETYVHGSDSRSGDIVTWKNMLIKDVVANIEPIQDLHGYDKPWSGGNGKNKLPNTATTQTIQGVTFTVNSDGSIKANGTSTGWNGLVVGTCTLEAGTWYMNSHVTTDYAKCYLEATGGGRSYATNTNPSKQIVLTETTTLTVKLYVPSGQTVNNVVCSPLIHKDGTTADYEPYTNICPISGRTEVVTSRCGENVWNEADTIEHWIDTSGNEAYREDSLLFAREVTVGQTYTLSNANATSAQNILLIAYYGASGNLISRTVKTNGDKFLTVAVPTNAVLGKFCIFNKTLASDIQLELGTTATDYEPYTSETYTTDLGQTVYGGTLDVVSGLLTVDRVMVDLGGLTWTRFSGTISAFRAPLSETKIYQTNEEPNIMSSQYSVGMSANSQTNVLGRLPNGTMTMHSNYALLFIRDDTYTTASDFKTAMDGVQLCYELATPQTIQLTPQEVSALVGWNALWTNCDSVRVDLTGVKDFTDDVSELKITADGISTRVSSTETRVSGTEARLSTAESTITQQATAIEAKVSKDGVIASINASVEQQGGSAVKISADKVNIEGAAIFTGSGRLSTTSLNNAYDAKGTASAVQTALQADIDAKKSTHTIQALNTSGTQYTATYADILDYATEGRTGLGCRVASIDGINVGDTVRLAFLASDMGTNGTIVYIIGTVDSTSLGSYPSVFWTSHGLDTTVIDGGHILTGTIDADRIGAGSLSVGKLNSTAQANIQKGVDSYDLQYVSDTRNTNENPQYYITNYSRKQVNELKYATVIGIPNAAQNSYCTLTTIVPWGDSSGGFPKQEANMNGKRYWREGSSETAWTAWKDATATATDYITHIDNNGIRIHPSSTENNSVKINADGMTVYKGGTADANSVAFYGDTARIGKASNSHLDFDYHSMQFVDKDGTAYVNVSDLRGNDGTTTLTEDKIANGTDTDFGVSQPIHLSQATVKVNGTAVTPQSIGSYSVTLSSAPASGAVVSITYVTTSAATKAYTFGQRASNYAVGAMSFASGMSTVASSGYSHAEGYKTIAAGSASHAEGNATSLGALKASGVGSHAEGVDTLAVNYADHAEGQDTVARGSASHAGGVGTTANGWGQTAIGKYNVADSTSLFIVGTGTPSARANALLVDANGNVRIKGDIYAGCSADSTGGTALNSKTYGTITSSHTLASNQCYLIKRGNVVTLTLGITLTSNVSAYGTIATLQAGYRPDKQVWGQGINCTFDVTSGGNVRLVSAKSSGQSLNISITYVVA